MKSSKQTKSYNTYNSTLGKPASRHRQHVVAAVGVALISVSASANGAQPAAAPVPANPWKFTASAGVKETFDSNVYLQSETDKANQSSLVTTLSAQAALAWNPTPLFNAALNYAPEFNVFHAEDSENFTAHRVGLTLGGKSGKTAYESTTSLVFIDGSSVGPTWTGPGGAPATGGPAVRDRRDAAVYRSSLRITENLGEWFVRPTATFYLHDFQTEHRSTPGYQNYVDRNELVGGVDLGRRWDSKSAVFAGYRYGVQDQADLAPSPIQYDSSFHRVLFGIEGQPAKWLKTSVALGPEFRHFGNHVPTNFGDHDRVNFYVDASVTVIPSTNDSVALSIKQFEQPGFGGRSVYEDLTYDLMWRHKFNSRWTAGLGGRAYNTDFLAPVVRNDWVLSLSTFVNCNITTKLNAELSYTFEKGVTHDANASGREYDRHLVAAGIKYAIW